ncbi:hypothetical protein [Micromonospora sp. NPDC048063]|uniref:hypothetical protein n=1 Tax=Micromonospora sp. NPDC048063 TaxID=3364256 RepID=UPI00371BA5E1
MRVVVAVQAAILATLLGVLLLLAAVAPQPAEPAPARTWWTATEDEQRQYERDRLAEELERAWRSGR